MDQKSLAVMERGADPSWLTTLPLPARRKQTSFFGADVAAGTSGLRQAAVEAHAALNETIVTAATVAQKARAMTRVLEEALAVLALAEADLTRHSRLETQPSTVLKSLSPREREVLSLVAEGYSNKVIAGKLFVSPNTVKSHVASLLNKLHADSRVELATIATRHQVGDPERAPLPNGVLYESQEPGTPLGSRPDGTIPWTLMAKTT